MASLAVRAGLLGAATGLRASVGVGALILRGNDGLPTALRHPGASVLAAAGVAFELFVDKLPTTPSRLAPAGLGSRVLFASLAAVVLARSEQRSPLVPVLVASMAALASARLGHDLRAAIAERLPDALPALAEDAVALALAATGSVESGM